MKKSIFLLIALLAGALNLFAQCETVPTSTVGAATITFVRYAQTEIIGEFTVGDGKKVRFAQGNLQYCAKNDAGEAVWRFAEHQYDIIGADNTNISSLYKGWIDLFGWACSGFNNGATSYMPYSATIGSNDYYEVAAVPTHISGTNADWAWYNVITNGGAGVNQWRVLTKAEWDYLFETRDHAVELYGLGKLMGVSGLFIIPDNWWGNWDEKVSPSLRTAAGFTWTAASKSFNNNVIPNTAEGRALWNEMEQHGAVFLPAGGYRHGTTLSGQPGSYGHYWNATSQKATHAYVLRFYDGNFKQGHPVVKTDGRSIRPVMDVK